MSDKEFSYQSFRSKNMIVLSSDPTELDRVLKETVDKILNSFDNFKARDHDYPLKIKRHHLNIASYEPLSKRLTINFWYSIVFEETEMRTQRMSLGAYLYHYQIREDVSQKSRLHQCGVSCWKKWYPQEGGFLRKHSLRAFLKSKANRGWR